MVVNKLAAWLSVGKEVATETVDKVGAWIEANPRLATGFAVGTVVGATLVTGVAYLWVR